MNNLNINQIHQKFLQGKLSALELTRECLKVIEKKNKQINAFLSLNDKAEEQAREIDEIIKKEQRIPGLLAGIPVAVKDNILVKGMPCTAGSLILKNYYPVYEAEVIKKLRQNGAIILGKTNLDEFAMGSSTETSFFGPTKNPYNLQKVPGGSSGGSAAAVSSNMCLVALGSDTGGSVRQPASFCGVVGLKPTYGRISRFGLIAMASSLDQIGVLAKNIQDTALVLRVIEGKDEKDETSLKLDSSTQIPVRAMDLGNLRIALPKEIFSEGLENKVKEKFLGFIEKIEKRGAKVEKVSFPYLEYALSCYYLIMSAEASSNLARYDGIRYGGIGLKKTKNLEQIYLKTRTQGFGDEVKRRIIMGTFVLSRGFQEKYYLKAVRVRNQIKKEFQKTFSKYDFVITPTSPTLPFKIGERISDPLAMYLSDIYTVPANLAGLPALSQPIGFIDKLPVGIQIIGNWLKENLLFSFSQTLENLVLDKTI